jgi:hypothetical protein
MAPNANGSAFGPKVYMDAANKAVVCAISATDTATISAFQESLAAAFVKEAANPGGGLPRQNVDQSLAKNWAAVATNGIMGGCLLGNNGGSDTTVTMDFANPSGNRATLASLTINANGGCVQAQLDERDDEPQRLGKRNELAL